MNMLEKMNAAYRNDPNYCRCAWYRERNEACLAMLRGGSYKVVIEQAGGSGLLAEAFLREHPETKRYVLNDLSPVALDFAQRKLAHAGEYRVEYCPGDAADVDVSDAGLVLNTAMEHLPPGSERRTIDAMPLGAEALFATSNFIGGEPDEHVNVCDSISEAIRRCGPSAELICAASYPEHPGGNCQFIVHVMRA